MNENKHSQGLLAALEALRDQGLLDEEVADPSTWALYSHDYGQSTFRAERNRARSAALMAIAKARGGK